MIPYTHSIYHYEELNVPIIFGYPVLGTFGFITPKSYLAFQYFDFERN
jgi:hypothetical protein